MSACRSLSRSHRPSRRRGVSLARDREELSRLAGPRRESAVDIDAYTPISNQRVDVSLRKQRTLDALSRFGDIFLSYYRYPIMIGIYISQHHREETEINAGNVACASHRRQSAYFFSRCPSLAFISHGRFFLRLILRSIFAVFYARRV